MYVVLRLQGDSNPLQDDNYHLQGARIRHQIDLRMNGTYQVEALLNRAALGNGPLTKDRKTFGVMRDNRQRAGIGRPLIMIDIASQLTKTSLGISEILRLTETHGMRNNRLQNPVLKNHGKLQIIDGQVHPDREPAKIGIEAKKL